MASSFAINERFDQKRTAKKYNYDLVWIWQSRPNNTTETVVAWVATTYYDIQINSYQRAIRVFFSFYFVGVLLVLSGKIQSRFSWLETATKNLRSHGV